MEDKSELFLNKVPIHKRLKPESTKIKKIRKHNLIELDIVNTDSSQSNENELIHLKEPDEKVKLIERAIGYFNTDKDEERSKNALNISTNKGPPFICNICHSWFYMGSKLKVHYILNHNHFHCEMCSIIFETQLEKQTHISKYHTPVFCEICQKYFSTIDLLLAHYETEHDSTTCKFCGLLLQPKSLFESHIIRKHMVDKNYAKDKQRKFVELCENGADFHCSVCDKNREIDVFFGHMNSYHKMSVTSLINLLVQHKCDIKVEGATKREVKSEKEDCTMLQDKREAIKNTCQVCCLRYSKKIPCEFHYIYCQSKIQCKYCDKYFTNATNRDKHTNKSHSDFFCQSGCEKQSYASEEILYKHYLKYHETIACRYCDAIVSMDDYDLHLEKNHKYKAVMMKNFSDTLFEIMEKKEKHIVVCCLCDENISLLAEHPKDVFLHYEKIHTVSVRRILQLLTPKPVLKDYEDFYREINESIKRETDETDQEEIPDEINNEESILIEEDKNFVSSTPKIKIKLEPDDSQSEEELEEDEEKLKDFSHLESEIESDYDVEETELLLDSEIESDSEIICEFCGEEADCILDVVKHLHEKHKLKTKYNKIECKYCREKQISLNAYAKHICTHLDANSAASTTELFNCNCDIKVANILARGHIVEKHKQDLHKYNLKALGLKCRFCEIRYWERTELNQHEVDLHFEDNVNYFQKCFKCLAVFSSQKCLKDHLLQQHPESLQFSKLFYKCLHCNIAYPSIDSIRQHFRLAHPLLKIFRCPVPHCFKSCKRIKYISKHLKAPHAIKTKNAVSKTCDVCGKMFRTVRAASIHKLMKHQRTDRAGFQCRICQERFQTSEQRKLHYTTAHPGQLAYSCLECGKGFISKSGLYGHKKIHQQQENMVCPYCSKEFSRRDSYNEHLLIHIGPRHQCPHCPKSFTQRSNLTRHVRIHTGAKPYQCIYCEKRFSDKGACRSHERVHTKEEHCQCSYCGKKFTKKQKLKYHIKFHTGEGLVNCEVCGKQFSNSYSLNEHRRIHNQQTLVMCNCGRGFTSEKYLQRHMTNVHNDSPAKYICPICFKPLLHKSSYNDHIMTHTAVKHVKCLLCNQEYNTKKTVKRHLYEKHNLELTEDVNKYIYQLTPQDVGLNVPSASEMSINVNDLLDDKNVLNIDISHLKSMNGKTADVLARNEDVSVRQRALQNGAGFEIKEEVLSDSFDDTEDEVVLEVRAKRKIKTPVRYKRRSLDEQNK